VEVVVRVGSVEGCTGSGVGVKYAAGVVSGVIVKLETAGSAGGSVGKGATVSVSCTGRVASRVLPPVPGTKHPASRVDICKTTIHLISGKFHIPDLLLANYIPDYLFI
jgi:hypothetical protein